MMGDYKKRLSEDEAIELHRIAKEVSKWGSILYADMDFERLSNAMTELNTFLLQVSLRQKDEPLGNPDCIVCGGQGFDYDYQGCKHICPCIASISDYDLT